MSIIWILLQNKGFSQNKFRKKIEKLNSLCFLLKNLDSVYNSSEVILRGFDKLAIKTLLDKLS